MKNTFYMPLTAAPFRHNKKYKEALTGNQELAKYIRCFWGSEKPYLQEEKNITVSIVVPDTCVDIIYHIDYTDHIITGGFCGINDVSFFDFEKIKPGHLVSVFAIRFYAWGAYAFSEDSLKDTRNDYSDAASRFRWLDVILRQQLFEKNTMEERIKAAEEALFRRMFQVRQNTVVNSAVNHIVLQKGAVSAAELAKECFISSRQLERLFHEYIGITPKKLCNLVRYQFLWNDILRNSGFDIQNAVYEYGYTDQSHLLREFKRYHSMDIQEAKGYAYNHVENIQYVRAE